ncbi:MAG: hypothetical protein ACE5NM_10475, partial [Sedimentisphaerales bacterium]
MKADENKTVAEEATSILQLERPLLPIDKYAARKGLTRAIVEECGRLGILHLRKYKGKTYVVDVPPSPYQPACEEDPILRVPTSQCIAKQGPLPESYNMAAQVTPKSAGSRQTINKTTQAKKISEGSRKAPSQVTQKVAPDAHKIMGKPAKSNIESARGGPTLAKNMFCKASKIKRQLIGKIKNETTENFQFKNRKFSGLTEQAQAKRAWQVTAVSLIVCLCVVFLTGLWLYMNQRVHRSRLDQASASIQNVYDDSVRTSQQLATFQSKLVESTAELEWVKNELNNTKAETETTQAEIKSLRHEITKVRQTLETVQQHNIAALEQLKQQFQQLTAQLSEFIQNNQ